MSDALLSVSELNVRYATRVVHDVSLDIQRGETLALVGESGSGKTTTARAILRLVEPESGRISLGGINIRELSGESLRRMRRRMQIVFQDPYGSLDPRMTVREIIGEGMRAHGIANGAGSGDRIAALLSETGLAADDGSRFPHQLSGGQRQRVAIARALALDPELLVLDEAVSALDTTTQARILDLFERIRDARGLTCLFIAHNLAVVQRVASSVAVMKDGRLVEVAAARSFFAGPEHPYSRVLLKSVPRIPAMVR